MLTPDVQNIHPAFPAGREYVESESREMASHIAKTITDEIEFPIDMNSRSAIEGVVFEKELTENLRDYDAIDVLSIGLVILELNRNGFILAKNEDLCEGLLAQVRTDLEIGEAYDTLHYYGALEK